MAESDTGVGCIHTRHVFDTEYTADSAEWCPLDGKRELLLCGTYQLREPHTSTTTTSDEQTLDLPKKRTGRIYLFLASIDKSEIFSCTELARIETAGVLDIKWNSVELDQCPVFSVADSDGSINLYSLSPDKSNLADKGIKQIASASLKPESENVLALSLDWSTTVNKSTSAQIIASDSGGGLNLLPCDESKLTVLSQWKAHDFEAWIAAFNSWDTNIVYSGGDDCKLKGWDLRDPDKPIFVSKRHETGVVSIQSNPIKEHVLATGSYDEHLLIWDNRQMKCPMSDTALEGGIFRVKWHPIHGQKLLTASMHNGFHVLDATQIPADESALPVIGHYFKEKHGSLAYGADWSREVRSVALGDKQIPGSRLLSCDTIATCSFYDHSLHIWDIIS